MVDTLKVDTAALKEAAASIAVVAGELSIADSYADQLGSAVGHAGLAQRLTDFQGNWRIRREELRTQVDALSGLLTTVVDAFVDADRDLATNIRGEHDGSGK